MSGLGGITGPTTISFGTIFLRQCAIKVRSGAIQRV